ncbi:two-pore potassium channel 5 [Tripterygium wilfordii]|uniref:Two-pore potassium channel 5 n=1 Tax=Tripterygium wilfordii TaxID=458696 RepID=A0A7J7CD34_TRIWF|nr:two-pore potassium channel 5 [Tripterygium wilfordii]
MENEPFLATQTGPSTQLEPILQGPFALPQSLSAPILFPEIEFVHEHEHEHEHLRPQTPKQPQSRSSFNSGGAPVMTRMKKPGSLRRSKTAPAMVVLQDVKTEDSRDPKPQSESGSIVRQSFFLLAIYLIIGVCIYALNTDNFSGVETHPVVDALYFCIVTMCTIGYGDITPLTPSTKLFACVFVLVGFGFIDILLSGLVNYALDMQESMILTGIQMSTKAHHGFSATNYIVDVEKGRMRIRLKVGLALGSVVLCIGIGTLVLCFLEDLNWIDSVYLSVMSVTTVGYGDRAFNTLTGRLFAGPWLLFSTLAVARAFLYLAEARIDKRQRRIAKWVLDREITVEDLLKADINNTGFLRAKFTVLKFCPKMVELVGHRVKLVYSPEDIMVQML